MMDNKTFKGVVTALRLETLSPDQYREIIDVIRANQARKRDTARRKFRRLGPGAKVKWTGRYGTQTGTLERVLRKNAQIIETHTGQRWRVPMSILEEA